MTGVLTETVARLLLAPSLAVAAAILVKGYSDVGDGFTAGVVAALAVLLQHAAFGYREVERSLPVRFAFRGALAGLALALAVALVPALWGAPPLTHYPAPGTEAVHVGTLELVTAILFDAAVFLLVLGASVAAVDALARAPERSES